MSLEGVSMKKWVASRLGTVVVLTFVAVLACAIPAAATSWNNISGVVNTGGSWILSNNVHKSVTGGTFELNLTTVPVNGMYWRVYFDATGSYGTRVLDIPNSQTGVQTLATSVLPNTYFQNSYRSRVAWSDWQKLWDSNAFSGQENF